MSLYKIFTGASVSTNPPVTLSIRRKFKVRVKKRSTIEGSCNFGICEICWRFFSPNLHWYFRLIFSNTIYFIPNQLVFWLEVKRLVNWLVVTFYPYNGVSLSGLNVRIRTLNRHLWSNSKVKKGGLTGLHKLPRVFTKSKRWEKGKFNVSESDTESLRTVGPPWPP